jgi:replicative DNA helicase
MDIDNEKAVFGACFIDEEALDIALSTLSAKDFTLPSHQLLFGVMANMAENQIIPDTVTLATELKKMGVLDKVGGPEYIAELVDFAPSSAIIGYSCKQLKEASKKRQLMNIAKAIERNADLPADELQAKIEAALFDMHTGGGGAERIKITLPKAFKEIETAFNNRGKIAGIETGFEKFDQSLNGLNAPDLIVLAGRPAMGKSAMMGNIVEGATIERGVPAVIFSLEMSKEQLIKRMIFGRSRIDGARARVGNFQDGDWSRMANTVGSMVDSPVFIDDTPGLHVSELRARARRLKRKEGIGLVCIDYLQLLRGEGQNRVQEVGFISRSLKGMAKELNVPVVALCQLSRKLEERTNKRPVMSDLRDSGEIEQDADTIIFMYRDAVYNEKADSRQAEAIIAKQRNGPTGTVPLSWHGEYSRFENKQEGSWTS